MYESSSHIAEGVYHRLLEIDHYAHREYVRLYDTNLFSVNQLPIEKRIVLKYRYLNSLFELCEYERLLDKVDQSIEDLIYYNIVKIEEEDAYAKLLFLKAASLYNTQRLEESEYVLAQLIKIDPKNQLYRTAFIKNKMLQAKPSLIKTRGLAVFIFLLSSFVTAVQLLIIDPYMPEYNVQLDIGRYTLFTIGLFVLVLPELIFRLKLNAIIKQI